MRTLLKICSYCGKEKDTKEFSKRKAAKDGLRSQCKQCDSEQCKKKKEGTYIYKPVLPPEEGEKQCNVCKSDKLEWVQS